MTKVWEEDRSWEFAVATASALNSKWSSPETVLPFLPKDFMSQSPAEKKASEAQQAKLRKAQQAFMAVGLQAMVNSLPKTGGSANGTSTA